jgi:hypothetical protein
MTTPRERFAELGRRASQRTEAPDADPSVDAGEPISAVALRVAERLAARAQQTIGAPIKREPPSLEKPLTAEQRAEREAAKAKLAQAAGGLLVAIEGPAKPLPDFGGSAGNLGPLLGARPSVEVRMDSRDADRRALSQNERRERASRLQAARRATADSKWIGNFVSKQLASGVKPDAVPPNCARTSYLMVQEILADKRATQCKAQVWIRRFGDRYPWLCPALAMIRDAALQPLESGGFLFDFSDDQARRIVAEGLFMLAEAEKTDKKGRFSLILKGFSIGSIAGVAHAPGNPKRQVHRNRIGGAGRKPEIARANAAAKRSAAALARGSWTRGGRPWQARTTPERRESRTDLQRLRDAGFLYAQQLPAAAVAVWERDSAAHVRNRYWIATAGAFGTDAAKLHELGAMWASEKITTPLRAPPS